LLQGSPEAAGILLGAIEDFARELCGVLGGVLKLHSWRDTQRIVVGGGFRERRVGELAIGRTAVLVKSNGQPIDLMPGRYHPNEAGLIGTIYLAPSDIPKQYQGSLAVDIGGTNMRVGIIQFVPENASSTPRVWQSELWRHKDEFPSRDELVGRLIFMLQQKYEAAVRSSFRLAPFIGIACPGEILPNGAIARGTQNLPGDWEDPEFNLAHRIEKTFKGWTIVLHNDAVAGFKRIAVYAGRADLGHNHNRNRSGERTLYQSLRVVLIARRWAMLTDQAEQKHPAPARGSTGGQPTDRCLRSGLAPGNLQF
jgi:hypothetical protein